MVTLIDEYYNLSIEKDNLLVQLSIRIKELRKMKNMTQAELAHAIAKISNQFKDWKLVKVTKKAAAIARSGFKLW